ncbi:MAG: cytochrome c [Candidatus Scalindua sp.]|nr:cytochrome c [Candidatus Scalindua sp.]
MERMKQISLSVLCIFVITLGIATFSWKGKEALGDVDRSINVHDTTPTRALMQVISSHTSKILDAIMIGDFDAVAHETGKLVGISKNLTNTYFPDGAEGREFKVEGSKESKKVTKKEFEKYVKLVSEAFEKLEETSRNENIVETYNSFDSMLRKTCFACHEVARIDWPNFMKQAGG